jgi:hypothetical protein
VDSSGAALLDELLVATLRAVASPTHTMFPCVSPMIWLRRAAATSVALDVDLGSTEVRLRFSLRDSIADSTASAGHDLHAATAAP